MTPDVKGLRERNKEDKLARIEKAARQLFRKRGYDQTTTRDIAERAGIGAGTLFVYFPEKRDLLFHLFRDDVRAVQRAALGRLPEGPLIDRLMAVFGTCFDYYARDLALSRCFIKELGFVTSSRESAATSALALELMSALASLIAGAQRNGEVDPAIDPLAAGYHVFAHYLAALMGWLGGTVPSREAALTMLRSGLELLHRGLAPRPKGGRT